jgi:Lon protease-like protein
MPILRLPIFPLPLVLFPGAPQLLHIFEPRYREMLRDCMEGDRRFGISWVAAQAGEDPAPEPGSIGCIAHVEARTALPDGRANILTVGEDRYVLREYEVSDRLYRIARVATFDDVPDQTEDPALLERVKERFRKLTAALTALNDAPGSPTEVPEDPRALSFHVAAALEIDPGAKQELLRLRSSRRRLEILERILLAALEELGPRAEVHVRARRNGKGGPNAAIVGETGKKP